MQNFASLSILIMLAMIYFYEDELKKYDEVFQNRFFSPETHSQLAVTYVSKFSFITTGLFFVNNFSIFMFYFQISMLGIFSGLQVHIPLCLEFIILFFYINKHVNLHLRIKSMDMFQNQLAQ